MAKILICEDDFVAQEITRVMVEKMGHVPIISPHGKHALDTLEVNHDINLLITDMMMPVMNGTELVQILRGKSRFSHLPIIMVSGILGVNDIASLLDLGATRFQPKPLNEDLLAENVSACIGQYEKFRKASLC